MLRENSTLSTLIEHLVYLQSSSIILDSDGCSVASLLAKPRQDQRLVVRKHLAADCIWSEGKWLNSLKRKSIAAPESDIKLFALCMLSKLGGLSSRDGVLQLLKTSLTILPSFSFP